MRHSNERMRLSGMVYFWQFSPHKIIQFVNHLPTLFCYESGPMIMAQVPRILQPGLSQNSIVGAVKVK